MITPFVRRSIKLLFSATVYYSGILSLFIFINRILHSQSKPIILLYHRVLDDGKKQEAILQPGMCVTRSSFEGQIKYLSRHYTTISFENLVEMLADGLPIPGRSVVITFDDGWSDNYSNAYPVLKKYHVPAIIFLCSNMINTGRLPIFNEISCMLGDSDLWPDMAVGIFKKVIKENRLQENIPELDDDRIRSIEIDSMHFMIALMFLDLAHMEKIASEMKRAKRLKTGGEQELRYAMTWDEIRQMSQGGIDFGSHGVTHDLLIHLDENCIRQELMVSKSEIEQKLGKPVRYFSYPNHDFNGQIKKYVQEAGYFGAGAGYTISDDNAGYDIYALNRYNMNEGATIGPLGNFSKTIFALRMARRAI